MKKFFTLLTLFCMFVGAAWAEVTKFYKPGERLSTLTKGQKVMFYNTAFDGNQDRTGFLIDNAGNFALNKQKPSATPFFSEKVGVWTLENVANTDGVYTVNVKGANGYVGIGGKTNNADAQVLRFQEWTAADAGKKAGVDSENAEGTKVNNADISANDKVWLVSNADLGTIWNGNQQSFATWSTGHPYAVYSVVEATTEELQAMLDAAKDAAVNELNTLKQLDAIYTTAESAIAEVNAVALKNKDLETALNNINTLVAKVKAAPDGKSMKFRVDGRGSRFLGYSKDNKRVETLLGFDDAYWTFKYVGNGYFKLYNPVHKVWLGAPDGAKKKNDDDTETSYTAGVANENEAASFKFEVKEGPTVVLVSNDGKVAHAANDNRIMNYWDKSDRASWWAITDVCTFPISYDQYKEFLAEKSAIMSKLTGYSKQLQDKYGLVKSGDKMSVVVNHPNGGDCQPSSNLLDGNNGTYVHSSYDTTMEGEEMSAGHMNKVENHYIDVELSEAAQNIFCYFSKRNNNNRPAVVEVHAGNNADALNKVATLNLTESTDGSVQSYFSEGINLGAAYTHLRFVVTKTNTATKFFTLSEFYVLPVNDVTSGIASLAGASILKTDLETRLTAAGNSLKTLQLPETTAEVKAALEANVDNHAEIPVLGQYTTAAYNKLKAAYDACTSIDKLEALFEAFDEFNKAKNRPVFTISSNKDYVVGKSIYDDNDGTLNFKATDLWNKTMWWALDMTETEVKVTDEVGIYNVGTGNGFWGASSIKVTETNENSNAGIPDDGLFLFYTTGNNTPIHFQSNFSEIVRYGSYEATSGSAAMFTHIGNTYDLNKLTDEHVEALYALKKLYEDNLYYKDVVLSDVIGEYKGDKAPVTTALNNLKALLDKNLTELANMSVDNLNLETEANKISEAAKSLTKNLPVAGKYYQFVSSFKVYVDQMAAYAQDGKVMWKKLNSADKSFYWQAVATDKGIALKNVADGKFLKNIPSENGDWASVQWITTDASADAEIDVKILSTADSDNGYEYALRIGDWYMHTAGHDQGKGTSGNIVSWYAESANTASAWYLKAFDALPSNTEITYNFTYKGVQKYTETVSVEIGNEYPEFTDVVTLPYGVKVKGNKPSGHVSNIETFTFELELDLPFVVAETVEAINTWYYAQMHATKGYSKYIQALEDNKIEWSDKVVTEGEEDSHLWGFVGDVWTGIKVVNKATKEAIVSTGQDEATMGAVADATAFIPTASNARPNTDWFCLQHPTYTTTENNVEKNYYLNAQSGFVKHWHSADEGSSIFLTEPGMEFDVEVSDAGYATYYSAYRLAIPNGVEAYVVSSVANKYAVLTKVDSNVLPEYTAVILKAEDGTYTFVASVAETPTIASNKLKGTLVDTPVKNAYILANGNDGVGFYKAQHDVDVNGGTNATTNFINHANKAYLPVDAVTASARFISFDFGTETGIGEVEAEGENVVIYDLSGRRVQKAQKGLYIVNGKKVIK